MVLLCQLLWSADTGLGWGCGPSENSQVFKVLLTDCSSNISMYIIIKECLPTSLVLSKLKGQPDWGIQSRRASYCNKEWEMGANEKNLSTWAIVCICFLCSVDLVQSNVITWKLNFQYSVLICAYLKNPSVKLNHWSLIKEGHLCLGTYTLKHYMKKDMRKGRKVIPLLLPILTGLVFELDT